MPLTDTAIRKAKPTDKPQRLFDGGGLYLEIAPSGGKLWRWKYRHAGKEKRLALGAYPDVSLAAVRKRHAEARELLADGVDPGEQRKAQKRASEDAAANSVKAVANEYLATKAPGRTEGTAQRAQAWFDQHVFPFIGSRPVGEVDAPELLAVLQRMVKRGTLDAANRLRGELSSFWQYAIVTKRATHDPAAALRTALPRHTKKHFSAVTETADIADLLQAIEGYMGDPATVAALKLSPMLFQRPGEIRAMSWAEVNLDAAEWRIPGARQKLRKAAKENPRTPDHVVPLPAQAVAILRELHDLTGRARYVFPSRVDPNKPMSENTVRNALRRMGFTNEQMTPHGFRHMASTQLNELGYNPDAIERQLSHGVGGGVVRNTYNQAQYMAERKKMMQAWADYLDGLRTGANVVPNRTIAPSPTGRKRR